MTRPVIDQFRDCVDLLKIAGERNWDDDRLTAEVIKFLEAEVAWVREHSSTSTEKQQWQAAGAVLGRMLAITGGSCLRTQLGEHLNGWLEEEAATFVLADILNAFNASGPEATPPPE